MEKRTVEMELAQTGNINDLRNLLNHTFMSDEAQVALVERQDAELLCEYAEHYSFGEAAQIRLVEMRQKDILLKQLERHSLCIAAQKMLAQTQL